MMDEQEFRRTFQRGRLLVLIVAVGTLAVFLEDAAGHLWLNGMHSVTTSHIISWLFPAMGCWWFFRGGRLTAGCIGTMYGVCLLCFLAAIIYRLFGGSLNGFETWSDTAQFFLMGGWAAFALWVLFVSRDARLYREAQRQAICAQEADAFKWPPAGRR